MTSINLSQNGPPETVLTPEPTALLDALATAISLPEDQRRDAVASVLTSEPRFLDA